MLDAYYVRPLRGSIAETPSIGSDGRIHVCSPKAYLRDGQECELSYLDSHHHPYSPLTECSFLRGSVALADGLTGNLGRCSETGRSTRSPSLNGLKRS